MSSAAPIDVVPAAPAAPAARDIPDWMRVGLNVAVFVAFWNHLWLVDISDRSLLEASEGGSLGTQAIFVGLALAMGAVLWRLGLGRFRALATWPLLLCAGWLGLTVLTSVEPMLSIRRVLFLLITAFLAAGVLVVARDRRQFAVTLAIGAAIILASCYLAVALVPNLAVHSAFDVESDPSHPGLWRGIYPHKNMAGAGMVILTIVGLYVAAVLSRFLGWLIAGAAAIFLLGTFSKTSLALLPIILAVTALCRLLTGRAIRALLLVGPVLVLSVVSVGSIFLPPVQELLGMLVPDASFTGRSEIWTFAVENIAQRPLIGWGYGAFWMTERTMYGSGLVSDWTHTANHAHNAYLDTALIMGLPGLAVTILALVLAPLRDLLRLAAGRDLDPTTLLFVRLWFFALVTANFESALYNGNDATCCMLMMSVFGLRLQMSHRMIAG
ncbi:O-antigen ligase family protein [Methylobacterium nigriterrae]|uniref:O-antigen ligase family protein n=1 Tax=Methylobacterium nigriterrae TaxID=3127512 RepID=UPI003013A962